MIGRQSVGVGGISTATIKVEPATVPPMVSAPTFSHITPISNVASQGISALQTSSPSLIFQEANVANDSVQEHKPIINPVQQPVRPGGHGSLLNNLSQVRLMNSTSLTGGATSMGLPNIGTTPIQVHMSNMISSGMTSTPSVISSVWTWTTYCCSTDGTKHGSWFIWLKHFYCIRQFKRSRIILSA